MTEPKTPAEEWWERARGEEQNLSATCCECLKPIPVVEGDGSSPLADFDERYCSCGESTTMAEILEAHGLIELLPRMWYSEAERINES